MLQVEPEHDDFEPEVGQVTTDNEETVDNPPFPPQSLTMPPQSPIDPKQLSGSNGSLKRTPGGRLAGQPKSPAPCSQIPDPVGKDSSQRMSSFRSNRSTGSGKSTARTEALYLHAKVRSMKLEDKRREEEQSNNFQPELLSKRTATHEVTSTFQERQDDIKTRRQNKVQAHTEYQQREITGQPNLEKTAHINERVRSLLEEKNVPVHQSLHLKSLERQERKQEHAKKLHRECTFQPRLETEKSTVNKAVKDRLQTSVFDRLHDREKTKSIRSKSERESLEAEGCTFSPQLITKTYSRPTTPADATDGTPDAAQGPVHERLYQTASKRRLKLEALKEEEDRRHSQGCTFKPKINDSQKLLTRTASKENLAAHDRLYLCADERRKREELYASLADSEYTFKPKLNAPKDKAVQDEVNRLEALYKKGVQKQTMRGPKTTKTRDHGSALLTADSTIYGAAEDVNADWRAQKEEEDLRECTFQPVLATKQKPVDPPLTTERVDMEEALARDSENLDLSESNGAPQESFDYDAAETH